MNFIERSKSLWTTGTAAVTVAAVGDFFSSVNGYLLPVVAAVIAAFLAVLALLRNDFPSASTDPDRGTSRWSKHWVHVFSVFALVTAVIGVKSWRLSQQGGILATNVPAVSNLQGSMGLLQQSVQMQRETREAIEELSSTVKKETSNDPRKELANRGIAWTETALRQALEQRDLETVELFMRGHYDLQSSRTLMALVGSHYFKTGNFARNKPLLELLYKHGVDFIGDYEDFIANAPDSHSGMFSGKFLAMYSTPLMAIAKGGNMAEARWLIEHGDKSKLSTYGAVLAESVGCGSSDDAIAVAAFFIKSGVPAKELQEKTSADTSSRCQALKAAL